jgi:hypothetical protein
MRTNSALVLATMMTLAASGCCEHQKPATTAAEVQSERGSAYEYNTEPGRSWDETTNESEDYTPGTAPNDVKQPQHPSDYYP